MAYHISTFMLTCYFNSIMQDYFHKAFQILIKNALLNKFICCLFFIHLYMTRYNFNITRLVTFQNRARALSRVRARRKHALLTDPRTLCPAFMDMTTALLRF